MIDCKLVRRLFVFFFHLTLRPIDHKWIAVFQSASRCNTTTTALPLEGWLWSLHLMLPQWIRQTTVYSWVVMYICTDNGIHPIVIRNILTNSHKFYWAHIQRAIFQRAKWPMVLSCHPTFGVTVVNAHDNEFQMNDNKFDFVVNFTKLMALHKRIGWWCICSVAPNKEYLFYLSICI